MLGASFKVSAILPETGTVDDARAFGHLHTVQELTNKGPVVNAIEVVEAPPLLGATGEGAGAVELLTRAAANAALEEAVEIWSAALDQPLPPIVAEVRDLDSGQLGYATPGTVTLDSDGAGYGWFVDSTPHDHSEFIGYDPVIHSGGVFDEYDTVGLNGRSRSNSNGEGRCS